MDYLWLKALHIIAVLLWVGGMLVVAVTGLAFSARSIDQSDQVRTAFFAKVRRWDERVTTPAMLAVWAIGLTLAVSGGWFGQPWLTIKLALVLVLSAVHGTLSGGLRKLAAGREAKGPDARYMAGGIVAAIFVIVILVVIKPF